MLINLIDNAVKYGRRGGRLTCDIRRETTGGVDQAICEIGDDGEGIAAGRTATLFDPFQCARTSSDGAGLGLSFVATVLARHGGRISCRSDPGLGSTFTLSLPISA